MRWVFHIKASSICTCEIVWHISESLTFLGSRETQQTLAG